MNEKGQEIEIEKIFEKGGVDLRLLDFDNNKSDEDLLIYDCIFSHEFAKKFFGEKLLCDGCGDEYNKCNGCCRADWGGDEIKSWQYHLSKMVLEKEPLKYLEKFIKENK